MKPLKAKVSITLDEDVLEQVKKLSERDDRSLSQYINLVLKEYINVNLTFIRRDDSIPISTLAPINQINHNQKNL